ncbi:MAG TPA: thioredoxin fold domain-containing protein [Albitalea sp.]|nr:thioredoxin fold domain-containing protein [Albitalea sp.]
MNRRRFVITATTSAAALALLAACSDKAGESTAPAAAAPAAQPKLTPREGYELAAKGTGFTMGSMMAANTVYVFFDATCPHCAALWLASKPLLNRLKIVWMPIGLLRPQSGPLGATILSAPDPAAVMTENEMSVLEHRPGISVNPSLGDDVLAKVKANTDLFLKLGADSVPLIVYRNSKTGEYGSYAGQVQTDQLAAMVGI